MVRHEAVCEAPPSGAPSGCSEESNIGLPVVVVFEDRSLAVASGGDVVDAAGSFDVWGTRHASRV